MGEVIEKIHTFVLPNELNLYTFKTSFVYDSWNRLLQMTYPDGEILNYTYNTGGNLKSMESQYNNTPSLYISDIKYNKFEQKTDIIYGNGSESHYTYDNMQRLSTLVTQSINGTLQDIVYTYDSINNISKITNNANFLSSCLGGRYLINYNYDNLQRFTSSIGIFYTLGHALGSYQSINYEKDGRISNKRSQIGYKLNGAIWSQHNNIFYNYNQNQPHTVSNTTDNIDTSSSTFGWDANGNMTNQDDRFLCWDDINRLLGVTDRSYTSYYSYDYKGDRHYKLTGLNSYMNINGIQNKYTTLSKPTLYVEGFVVATPQGYTKHYYNGSERVASSIGLGGISTINTQLSLSTSWTLKKEESNAMMTQLFGNCLFVNLSSNTKPITMNLYRYQNILTGTISKYFYHTNHLGSSSWITDGSGNAIQHLQNLPFGEDWVDERSTTWNSRYTFTGKEKDTETGYHYFGARYYDSGLSIWLSVDPMSDKYPSMSPYNYCANNPVILVDPDGREVIFNSLIDVIVVGTQLLFNSHFRENYKALKNSTETYLFRGSKNYYEGKGGKFHTNGEILIIDYNLSKDGKGNNCFTNIRHETEHANQFEHGELGFDNQGNVNVDNNGISTPNWNNSATNYDVYDELNAWNAGYYGFFSGDAETSDRVYFMRLNETEKIEDLSRTYPNASSIIKNNTNTARIKTNTQYLLPYKPRN